MGAIDTKYFDLERKIEQAYESGASLISAGAIAPYVTMRNEVIEKYFSDGLTKEARSALLDIFDEVNKAICIYLGL